MAERAPFNPRQRALSSAEVRAHIEALIEKWRVELGLAHWVLTIRYDERDDDASCDACPRYETATLTFNVNAIRKERWTYYRLREYVVHELVHCIVWKASERAVTQIARAILRVAGLRYE